MEKRGDTRKNDGVAKKKATGKSSKKEEMKGEERGLNRGEMMEERGTSCLR